MHYLNESHILLFIVQILVLLGFARTLGVLCESVKIPALAGEILAGVMLGPTLLGRVSPELQNMLFPPSEPQYIMLETVSWLGVFFLLLASGFHVNVGHALRSGRAAILIGIVGVLFPIAVGFPVFSSFDPIYWGDAATAVSFPLFLSVAGSITAISVVARTLGDLGISKTPQASLALSACAINDIFGWLLFTVVLSLVTAHSMSVIDLGGKALLVIGFIVISIAVGAKILNFAIKRVQATSLPQPAAAQTLIVSVGLLCGAITQWMGIHAILGFFLAGTMAGSAKRVTEELRNSVSDTLHAIFVPLFFATLGLKIDFLVGLELWPTVIFCTVAILGKFVGAWIGAKLGKQSQQSSVLMGLIFIPGGAMEIVVATLAMELQLIGQTIFVAIVFSALLSSILAGPLIGIQARRIGIGKIGSDLSTKDIS
ncbi:cation:proton antiporter [Arenibacter sp. BSSL-BM3]|uniref:Cation:proton antiporter n=1 Tax=Arenibacter arenosicollis TaxID=2762274 RepID=A0ABR7QTB7_9FLAO|nr:cation:proton antiporter [Arenibacter arenosicollis]MBC8770418.1 cation:proton antiporter [Arenibacter arenosicollis]